MALARRTLFSLPILGAGLAAPGLLRAQGAGWCGQFQELRLGIPSAENERDAVARQEPFAAQVLPAFLSQALYTLESNARSASILGVVGAGGIGLALPNASASITGTRWPSSSS